MRGCRASPSTHLGAKERASSGLTAQPGHIGVGSVSPEQANSATARFLARLRARLSKRSTPGGRAKLPSGLATRMRRWSCRAADFCVREPTLGWTKARNKCSPPRGL
ncbi:hypothetical protein MRX96_044234 [Rhipicephalus microplus]